MDISAEPSKGSVSLSSMEKGSNSSKARMVRISWFSKSFSRWSKKDQISRRRFYFARACWNSRFFNLTRWTADPIFLARDSIFFRLESADSIAEIFSIYLESVALMVASKSDFTRFLVFSIRFIKRVKNKKELKNTIIINKQIPIWINYKADQSAHNVNKHYYLM